MKFLFDLFPVIFFFAAFKIAGNNPPIAAAFLGQIFGLVGITGSVDVRQAPILIATVVVILATIVQIAWVRLRHGKVDKMLWVSLTLVVFFGGMTLWLRDETFIKWKPTVLYWVFAVVLLVSGTALKKNLIRAVLEKEMQLPETVWARLNLAWAGFFVLLGIANLLVAFAFGLSTEVWVNFKLFGGMGLMFAFVLLQGLMLSKYIEKEPPT
jgi:intracellular septation protein